MNNIDEELQDFICFFPSVDFLFLTQDFLFIFLAVDIFVDFIQQTDFNTPLSNIISRFIDSFLFTPIDSIIHSDILTLDEKNKQCKSLFLYLYQYRNIYNAQFLTIDTYLDIFQKHKKLHISFFDVLLDYDFNRHSYFIDHNDNIIDSFKSNKFNYSFINTNILKLVVVDHPVFSNHRLPIERKAEA